MVDSSSIEFPDGYVPKILLGSFTYSGKEYCRKRFIQNWRNISYPGDRMRFCMVDNTHGTSYASRLRREHPGLNVVHVPRGKNTRDAIANAMNYLREKCLAEGYDYLFIVESDLFPPKDIIYRLLNHKKKVVGAIYEIGFAENRRPCVFVNDRDEKTGEPITRQIRHNEIASFYGRGLQQVHGMGVGCTMIHRSIFEEKRADGTDKYVFWYSSADDDRMAESHVKRHPDVYFYMDLHNNGFKVFLDTDLLIYHENSDWRLVENV